MLTLIDTINHRTSIQKYILKFNAHLYDFYRLLDNDTAAKRDWPFHEDLTCIAVRDLLVDAGCSKYLPEPSWKVRDQRNWLFNVSMTSAHHRISNLEKLEDWLFCNLAFKIDPNF